MNVPFLRPMFSLVVMFLALVILSDPHKTFGQCLDGQCHDPGPLARVTLRSFELVENSVLAARDVGTRAVVRTVSTARALAPRPARTARIVTIHRRSVCRSRR